MPASSGKVVRHRLNPGGNRDANRALHLVALNRLRRDKRTQAYVARRTALVANRSTLTGEHLAAYVGT